jgi:transposase
MLAVADRQRGLFDAAWCSDLLPEDSIYALLAEHGDRIVRDEDLAECYSERRGRPSIPPSLLAKVLLLAYRDGLSDERAMEALRFDLRWKVALDLPVDHPGFYPTSLVRFRARLLLHGMERLVFERSLQLATELGLIEGEAEQVVDSTAMLGAAAVQDTATLVRSGVRKLLDAVKAIDGEAAAGLSAGLRVDYSRSRVKPEGDWQDPDARMELLAEVAREAERALRAVEEDDELAADAAIADARGCCARSSARSSRSETTRSRARAEVAGRARSSPPMTPRCVTAARPRGGALQATSSTPRPRPRRRS